MDSFNQSVFDLFDGVAGDGQPGQHVSTTPIESSSNAGTVAGITFGGIFSLAVVFVGVLVALRRRVDSVADLCDRIVTLAEALTWRQGHGQAEDSPTVAPADAAPSRPNPTDDTLLAMRRLTSQCEVLRPDEEYV